MIRHFLGLYLPIVVILALASWGTDRFFREYDAGRTPTSDIAMRALARSLADVGPAERAPRAALLVQGSPGSVEIYEQSDIAGDATRAVLAGGGTAHLRDARGGDWMLQAIDARQVLALRTQAPLPSREPVEWAIALGLYAVLGLAVMSWLWPLRRDLRRLQAAVSGFGSRGWTFAADIPLRSAVRPLALAFQRMADRIELLIQSHKDMGDALSHEIRTPLARMRFEIEGARAAADERTMLRLDHIESDVEEIHELVSATLRYSILERADFVPQWTENDLTQILPAVVEALARGAGGAKEVTCEVAAQANQVVCDLHLVEAIVRNLVGNAIRHACSRVRMRLSMSEGGRLRIDVDDDGPGIPASARERIFEPFVRMAGNEADQGGFGLGLAIVRRAAQVHGGIALVDTSEFGGAHFRVEWTNIIEQKQ